MDLIVPQRRGELIADLEQRLGLKIRKVEVGGVDMLRDMAVVKVFYDTVDDEQNSVDHMVKMPSIK